MDDGKSEDATQPPEEDPLQQDRKVAQKVSLNLPQFCLKIMVNVKSSRCVFELSIPFLLCSS